MYALSAIEIDGHYINERDVIVALVIALLVVLIIYFWPNR